MIFLLLAGRKEFPKDIHLQSTKAKMREKRREEKRREEKRREEKRREEKRREEKRENNM